MKKCLTIAGTVLALLILISCNPEQPLQETPPSSTSNTAENTAIIEEETTTEPETGLIADTESPVPDGELNVHFIDVGQGDAILIDMDQTEILIDGGDRSPGVVSYLNSYLDGALEVMVATHPHADHIGGLIEVLSTYDVLEIWHNGDSSTSNTYTDFMAAVQSENAEVHIANVHDVIQADGLTFYVHNPSREFDSVNNNSIVLHMDYGDIDFLFTGDAEVEAEEAMMSLSSLPVPEVEVLKVGHHGSRTASSEDFLAVASPEVAIYSAGEGNSYGHPHQETIVALNNIGARVYGTDVHGNIVVTTDGETYTLQLEKEVAPVVVSDSSTLPDTSGASSETATGSESTEPPQATVATDVRITRIFYDGLVPRSESDEYVEITNLGSGPVDLAGWSIKDISEGYPSLTFPSYIMQPGKSIRVYTNEVHAEYGGFSFGSGKAVWNNSSPDTAALYNADGNEVSRESY